MRVSQGSVFEEGKTDICMYECMHACMLVFVVELQRITA